MKEYLIPWTLIGELIFPNAVYSQSGVQDGLQKILQKPDTKTIRKLDELKTEETKLGKERWEKFWLCKDFDIDNSHPSTYAIVNGKCEKIIYTGGH